ncbi:LysR family transcriptional regulator [Paraburkholderia fungorum]|uniref:LysR family transcriptional regulator n=1 Tax=Paraburkholderia fungorum TaxID=134537 RepID=UPI0038B9C4CC
MARSRIQLRHLLSFVKIVEAGSFSRAATMIHVAQPALSQQMAELEESLGVSLLHRSARGVQPTAAGKLLHAEAEAIIHRIEHLPDLVRSCGEDVTGVVRIGMSTVLAWFMSNAVASACKAALPNVTLHFVSATSGQLTSRVREHTLDMAVIFDGTFSEGVASHTLFRQKLFLLTQAKTLVGEDRVAWDRLRDMTLILPARPHEVISRTIIASLFNEGSPAPRMIVENDVFATLSAVQAGLGSALMAIGDLSSAKGGAEVKAVPLEPPIYMTVTQITSAEQPLAPAAEATSQVIRNLIVRYLEEQKIAGAVPV